MRWDCWAIAPCLPIGSFGLGPAAGLMVLLGIFTRRQRCDIFVFPGHKTYVRLPALPDTAQLPSWPGAELQSGN